MISDRVFCCLLSDLYAISRYLVIGVSMKLDRKFFEEGSVGDVFADILRGVVVCGIFAAIIIYFKDIISFFRENWLDMLKWL